MNKVIVGISGKQGSGKTTLSRGIQNSFSGWGISSEVLKFAQPLYEMHDAVRSVLQKYGYSPYDYEKKDGNLLQLLGTEWGRDTLGEGVWCDILKFRANASESKIVIVDDCRFLNELSAIKEFNNFTVRLEAPSKIRKARAEVWRDKENHPSEIALDYAIQDFDLVLDSSVWGPDPIVAVCIEEIFKRLKCTP